MTPEKHKRRLTLSPHQVKTQLQVFLPAKSVFAEIEWSFADQFYAVDKAKYLCMTNNIKEYRVSNYYSYGVLFRLTQPINMSYCFL